MMRRVLGIAVAGLLATGCVATFTPATNTSPVNEVDFSQLAEMKTGEACAVSYLFIFGPDGDANIVAAARAGGLQTVELVDYRYAWNPIRQKYCVVVYGR